VSVYACTPNRINVIGATATADAWGQILAQAFRANTVERADTENLIERGRKLVERPEFDWKNVGDLVAMTVQEVLARRRVGV